ncbi:hypothetical protein [Thalassobaculum salexigens]|uniref:hypothetical protein n=1 Tax=Thalassobaculum salexigens TaxID=455360 RepID=UPI00248E6866|nr:hypothetical protein [Thalassobaculum salexigens]
MTVHRYERGAIVWDMARGGLGLLVTGLPLVVTPMATTMTVIFGALATLFGVYVVRTWLRTAQAVEVDADGIRRTGPLEIDIPWADLDSMGLRYFSTRRDKNAGWMELKLTGNGKKLPVESSIDDFEGLVRHCMLVSRRKNLELSETTLDNLRALGLMGPAPEADGSDGPPSFDSSGHIAPKLEPGLRQGIGRQGIGRQGIGPDRDR